MIADACLTSASAARLAFSLISPCTRTSCSSDVNIDDFRSNNTSSSRRLFLQYHVSLKTFSDLSPIFRPPGTLVPKALCFTRDVFFPFFIRRATSDFRQPIAAKLCRMIAIWVFFIMQVQKFGGPSPQRNRGPKTCKIRRDFRHFRLRSPIVTGRWVCDDRFYGLVNRSNR